MIRVFDAFSGVGGFRSGLMKAGGFKFVGWCEIDKFAQTAYRALYETGGEQFYENIRRAHLKTPSKQEHKRHGTKKAIFIPKRSKYRLK